MKTIIAGLAVAFLGSVASADIVNQTTQDITVLGANVSNQTIQEGGKYVSPAFSVSMANCKVLDKTAPDSQKRVSYMLDCTDEISRVLGRPSAKQSVLTAYTYQTVNYDKCQYQGSGAQYGPECYDTFWSSEYMNCYAGYISVVVKEQAMSSPTFTGIGFFYNNRFTFTPKEALKRSATVQLKSGETAGVYEFGAADRCWAGSMTGSLNWSSFFKPFLQYQADGNEYRNWDEVSSNYLMKESIRSFDRRGELLSAQ